MTSQIDHFGGAQMRGNAAMDHAGVKVPFLYPHSRQNDTNFPSSSQLVLHQSEVDTTFTATSSTENVLGSGSTSIVTHMVIELKLGCKDGNGIWPPTLPSSSVHEHGRQH